MTRTGRLSEAARLDQTSKKDVVARFENRSWGMAGALVQKPFERQRVASTPRRGLARRAAWRSAATDLIGKHKRPTLLVSSSPRAWDRISGRWLTTKLDQQEPAQEAQRSRRLVRRGWARWGGGVSSTWRVRGAGGAGRKWSGRSRSERRGGAGGGRPRRRLERRIRGASAHAAATASPAGWRGSGFAVAERWQGGAPCKAARTRGATGIDNDATVLVDDGPADDVRLGVLHGHGRPNRVNGNPGLLHAGHRDRPNLQCVEEGLRRNLASRMRLRRRLEPDATRRTA